MENAEVKRASGTGPPTFIINVYKIYEISDAFNQNVRVPSKKITSQNNLFLIRFIAFVSVLNYREIVNLARVMWENCVNYFLNVWFSFKFFF